MVFLGLAALSLIAVAWPCAAADIGGSVVIKRKLTKSKVTAAASTYHRGTNVELGPAQSAEGIAPEYRRVVVYLEGDLPVRQPLTAVMNQKNRQFVPDTVVIPAGSSVSFPNLDPVFHNVFSLSKLKSFDLGNYPKDQTRVVTFPKPGVLFVNCHLHPNMSAAIMVTPNAWFTRVEPDGKFNFPQLPPGHYTVVAWHKAAGFFRKSIEVSQESVAIDFLIPLEEAPKSRVAQR